MAEAQDREEIGKKQKAFRDELWDAAKPYLKKAGYKAYGVGYADEGFSIALETPNVRSADGISNHKELQKKIKADLKPILDKVSNGRKYSMAASSTGWDFVVRVPISSVK